MHSFLSESDSCYKNILPPCSLLSENDKKKLFYNLKQLNFENNFLKVA